MESASNLNTNPITRIFITIPWFLPSFRAGGPIRSVANLVASYPDASFFIFTSPADVDGTVNKEVPCSQWCTYNEHTKVWYANQRSCTNELITEVRRVKPDVLFAVGLYSWTFTIAPLLYCRIPKKIVSVRGMLHPGALNQKSFKKKLFIAAFKCLQFHKSVVFHATDEKEAEYIFQRMGPKVKVAVAGNIPTFIGAMPLPEKQVGSLKMTSIALISPMKNLLKVIQALKQLKGEVEYNIYGAVKDPLYWNRCLAAINDLPANIHVSYHGELQPDLLPKVLGEHHLFVLPSESENYGHAIFEALSAGRPVITGNHTPWVLGQSHPAGKNVNPDNPEELKNALLSFISMSYPELFQYSENASQMALNNYNPASLLAKYRSLFSVKE